MDTTEAPICRTRYQTPSNVRHKTLILQQFETLDRDQLTEKKTDAKQLSLAVCSTVLAVEQICGTEALVHAVCILV